MECVCVPSVTWRSYLTKCPSTNDGEEVEVVCAHLVPLEAHVLSFLLLQIFNDVVLLLLG